MGALSSLILRGDIRILKCDFVDNRAIHLHRWLSTSKTRCYLICNWRRISEGLLMIPGRQKWTRTKTGCWTCRQAGYKCDECKPQCGRCTRLSITCQGYGPRIVWRDTATPESGGRGKKRKKTLKASPAAKERAYSATPSQCSTASITGSSTSEGCLEVIPRRVSNIPQDMQLEDYKYLYHWTTILSPLLSVTSHVEYNPFQQYLTPMAFMAGPLRYTILFCAAKHLSALAGQLGQEKHILYYQSLALRHLNQALSSQNEAVSDCTLASVLLMQLSQLFASDQEPRADHLAGATCIIRKRREVPARSNSCGRFLESLFRYHDVMSSITRGDRPLLDHNDAPAADSDAFLGNIGTLLEIISQISTLQPRKHLTSQTPADGVEETSVDSAILATGSSLEAELRHWTAPSGDPDWLNTAEAFRHAAFIYLYRVIYNIGAPHPLTLQHVRCCIEALRGVSTTSPLMSVHAWPIFTAGCESVSPSDRDFCARRLQDMFHIRKLFSLLRVKRAMAEVWSRKDQEALHGADKVCKIDCIDVLKQRGRELELG